MMIRVGGKYMTKTGECVKIVSSDESEPYSFLGDNGEWYTKEGRYNSYKETDKDLGEFSTGDVSDTEQTVKKGLKLEVGKTYINGYGRKITIVKYNSDFHFYPFVSSEGNTYTKDGLFSCINSHTKDDLIKEVKDDNEFIIRSSRVYRNGKGENILIVFRDDDNHVKYPFTSLNGDTYTENGIFDVDVPGHLDNLIEEVDDGIKIEVGKTYLNRKGEKIKIDGKCDNPVYPFVATEGYFTESGCYYSSGKDKNDLIEEFVNKDTDTNEKLNFRIGEDYVNRHGQIRTILNYNENEKYCYLASEDETFTKDGEYLEGTRSNLDLVGLAKPTLKVEVGKTYLNGDGEKVYIMKESGNSKYPFVSDRTGYVYSPEGYFNINKKTSCDLVCEVKEKPSLGLKVGKRYKTRSWDIVTIVEKRNSGTHPFVSDNGWTYNEDGSYYTIGENSSRDIVSRVIKLEVGKEYQTRDGEIVKIIGKTSSCIYPFQSDRGTYTEDGWFTSSREKRRQDIVREIEDLKGLQIRYGVLL